jgi:hypothetical protein
MHKDGGGRECTAGQCELDQGTGPRSITKVITRDMWESNVRRLTALTDETCHWE